MNRLLKSFLFAFGFICILNIILLFTNDFDYIFDSILIKFDIVCTIFLTIESYIIDKKQHVVYKSSPFPNKKYKEIIVDHDKKNITLDIENNSFAWFDYDIFNRNKYNIGFNFHSDNFSHTGFPADFSATKNIQETYMNAGDFTWFYVELDNRCIGSDHTAAKNTELENLLFELMQKDKQNIKSIYECTFKISNYKTLSSVFKKVSDLSENVNITKNFSFNIEYLNDFISKITSMPDISEQ